MAYKVFFLFYMKETGEKILELRKKCGISLEEASQDLGVDPKELECIETGNFKAFKDAYEMKEKMINYAKYIGLEDVDIDSEFQDYIFEKTSKISVDDLKNMIKEEREKDNEENRVSSPYTKIQAGTHNYIQIVFIILICVFIFLGIYVLVGVLKQDHTVNKELFSKEAIQYEFTK